MNHEGKICTGFIGLEYGTMISYGTHEYTFQCKLCKESYGMSGMNFREVSQTASEHFLYKHVMKAIENDKS